jgi:hypothetical protein
MYTLPLLENTKHLKPEKVELQQAFWFGITDRKYVDLITKLADTFRFY